MTIEFDSWQDEDKVGSQVNSETEDPYPMLSWHQSTNWHTVLQLPNIHDNLSWDTNALSKISDLLRRDTDFVI